MINELLVSPWSIHPQQGVKGAKGGFGSVWAWKIALAPGTSSIHSQRWNTFKHQRNSSIEHDFWPKGNGFEEYAPQKVWTFFASATAATANWIIFLLLHNLRTSPEIASCSGLAHRHACLKRPATRSTTTKNRSRIWSDFPVPLRFWWGQVIWPLSITHSHIYEQNTHQPKHGLTEAIDWKHRAIFETKRNGPGALRWTEANIAICVVNGLCAANDQTGWTKEKITQLWPRNAKVGQGFWPRNALVKNRFIRLQLLSVVHHWMTNVASLWGRGTWHRHIWMSGSPQVPMFGEPKFSNVPWPGGYFMFGDS